jgi:hypothetical protein
MARYLTPQQVHMQLHAGRNVEYWLGASGTGESTTIRFAVLQRESADEYSVTVWHKWDNGDEDWVDVYNFYDRNSEAEPYRATFETSEAAVAHAVEKLGANPEKFVGSGLIQDEYEDYVKQRK